MIDSDNLTDVWLNVDKFVLKVSSQECDTTISDQNYSLFDGIIKALSLNDSNHWHDLPGLPFAFNFEANIDGWSHVLWFRQNWQFSIYASILYMIIIFLGSQWMKTCAAFNLRGYLSLWSGSLAIFSIFGAIRCLPEFVDILLNKGFIESFCSNSYSRDNRLVFWYLIFIWSKLAELGDTAFIVLRKQKLINLHWIHHVLTLCYCFFVFKEMPGTARWMVGMNFAIHSLMYTYYCLRALRFTIPRIISVMITTGQIVQMIFGLIINAISFYYKIDETYRCDMTMAAASTGLALYLLFFVLFVNFFVCTYLLRPSVKRIVLIDDNGNIKNIDNNNYIKYNEKHKKFN